MRDREIDRERERGRERERERQRARESEKEGERERERQPDREQEPERVRERLPQPFMWLALLIPSDVTCNIKCTTQFNRRRPWALIGRRTLWEKKGRPKPCL